MYRDWKKIEFPKTVLHMNWKQDQEEDQEMDGKMK
jgi:hypothetical protein